MFRSAPPAKSQLDEYIERATNESRTSEDWGTIFALTDLIRVTDDAPRLASDALIARLGHRNANVQLQAVAVIDACYKNCGEPFHVHVPRAILPALVRLISAPATNDAVRQRALSAIQEWTQVQPVVAAVSNEYQNLQRQGYRFPQKQSQRKAQADKLKEDEEIQLALAISLSEAESRSKPSSGASSSASTVSSFAPASQQPSQPSGPVVCRVIASFDFPGSDPGELSFRVGDIIDVTEKVFPDWWRGRLNNAVGVFPANHVRELGPTELVKPVLAPAIAGHTAAAAAATSAATAAALALAALEQEIPSDKIELLFQLLSAVDPARKNVADDETIQELMATCGAAKPRIVQVICEYEKKRDELVQLNERFARAKASYDRMLSAAVARSRQPQPAPQPQAQQLPSQQQSKQLPQTQSYPAQSNYPTAYTMPYPSPQGGMPAPAPPLGVAAAPYGPSTAFAATGPSGPAGPSALPSGPLPSAMPSGPVPSAMPGGPLPSAQTSSYYPPQEFSPPASSNYGYQYGQQQPPQQQATAQYGQAAPVSSSPISPNATQGYSYQQQQPPAMQQQPPQQAVPVQQQQVPIQQQPQQSFGYQGYAPSQQPQPQQQQPPQQQQQPPFGQQSYYPPPQPQQQQQSMLGVPAPPSSSTMNDLSLIEF